MSHPSSLFARSTGELTDERSVPTTHPSSGAGSSLFARATRRVRTVALDDIVDDLLASRLTRLTHLEGAPAPEAPASTAPASTARASTAPDAPAGPPAPPERFEDLDDVVGMDLLDDLVDLDDGFDEDVDDEHLRHLEELLDLDEIDAHHVATRDDPPDPDPDSHPDSHPDTDDTRPPGPGALVRQSRTIRNRWDVRDRRIGLEARTAHVDLRDHFAVTDREAADALTCLVEWLLARPAVSDLARTTPRGLFSLHALGRAGLHASHGDAVPARHALDRFVTFET